MDTIFLTQLLKKIKLNSYFVFGAAFAFFVGLMAAVIWLLPTEPAEIPDLTASPTPSVISELPNSVELIEVNGQFVPTGLPVTYEVQPGDSSWSIAVAFYGSGFNYVDIETANNLPKNARLEIGQQLQIPAAPVKGQGRGERVQPLPPPTPSASLDKLPESENAETYVIQSGDSLWKIAENQLGDPYRWVEIYALNKESVDQNPDLIYPGKEISLPENLLQ